MNNEQYYGRFWHATYTDLTFYGNLERSNYSLIIDDLHINIGYKNQINSSVWILC